MAYVRRNYKHIELVESRRINGTPRIKVLARCKDARDLDKKLKELAKPLRLDYKALSKKSNELFEEIKNNTKPAKIGEGIKATNSHLKSESSKKTSFTNTGSINTTKKANHSFVFKLERVDPNQFDQLGLCEALKMIKLLNYPRAAAATTQRTEKLSSR